LVQKINYTFIITFQSFFVIFPRWHDLDEVTSPSISFDVHHTPRESLAFELVLKLVLTEKHAPKNYINAACVSSLTIAKSSTVVLALKHW